MNILRLFSVPVAVTVMIVNLLFAPDCFSQPDPNFYIFLAFGQSNMDGAGKIETQDKTGVSDRFRVMYPADNDAGRTKGKWATATPPLCRSTSGLCPADYFGRTLIDSLPSNIKIGIINVAIPGTKIEVFVKETYQSYLSGLSSQDQYIKTYATNSYGGSPYGRLVEMGKLAQKDGVIKGFLLHQGESNPNDAQWVKKVKSIYDNFLTEFGLKASETPLLAGELLYTDKGGACGGFNKIIDTLHKVIPNAYAISANGLTGVDQYHFTSASYRTFGKRYADTLLTILRKQGTGVDKVQRIHQQRISSGAENVSMTYSSGIIHFQGISDQSLVQVIDTKGRVVVNAIVNQSQIAVKDLVQGMYLLRINNKDMQPATMKLVIN
jgi:Carbohydrate esterase, sialic acid-specific acetylesterase